MNDSRGTATRSASRWAPPAVWAGFILVLTSWPSITVTSAVSGVDKAGHFAMYGILGILVSRALRPPRAFVTLGVAAAAMVLFGALDEWHQLFIPGREATVGDWLADVLGALSGIAAAHLLLPLAPVRPDTPS